MHNKPEPTHLADLTFAQQEPFALSGGGSLCPVTMRYAIYGHLNARRDNAVLVCHALSGSARVGDWWAELFGPDRPFDTSRYAIIGINVLGSCYGSTGPTSIDPHTGRRYGGDFPVVSIHDVVRAQACVMDHLGVERLHAVVGGSIGGMQALTWATEYPERVARCVSIGAAPTSAMALALGHLQRQAIRNDPAFRGGHYPDHDPPRAGLALARGLAMCSYKSAELFDQRYGRKPDRSGEDPARSHDGRFDVAGYLDYQGRLFNDRFDANSYLVITRAMDAWDLGATPELEARAMRRIEARALLVGISSDWLFPAADVRAMAERMRAAGVDVRYRELRSSHGHDAFLADADELIPLMAPLFEAEPSALVGRDT